MQRPFLFVALFIALCIATFTLLASVNANASTATYRLTITNSWTESTHPIGYPDEAHFSWFGGGTHAAPESFWELGGTSTPGFEILAESGETTPWVNELEAAGASGLEWRHWFCTPQQTHPNCGPLSVTFEASSDKAFLSLASMLGPSPDWFVGVNDLELRENGGWKASLSIPLSLYDAGTETGTTPTIDNLSNSEPMGLLVYDASTGNYIPSATPYSVGQMTLELLGTTPGAPNRPTLLSATAAGTGANGTSWDPSMSADGTIVAFSSDATNLTASDPNGSVRDVFVLNRNTGELSNVTAGGNDTSEDPVLSKDGRWLAFTTRATNLATDVPDTNGSTDDIVLLEVATGLMTLVTQGANAASGAPSLSRNGRRLVFDTFSDNLASNNTHPFGCVPGSAVNARRCYKSVILYDRVTTKRLNLSQGAESDSHLSRISESGNHVAFVTRAFKRYYANGQAFGEPTALVMDLDTGVRVQSGIAPNTRPIISASGRWVAASDGNVLLRDMSIESSAIVIATDSDIPGEFASDESRIVYSSVTASRLLPDPNQAERDVYALDLTALPNLIETRLTAGGNGPSGGPVTNHDGTSIAFDSTASNFANDNNGGLYDVFFLDTTVVSSDQPIANPQELSVAAGTDLAITLTGFDPVGAPLLFELVSDPSQGTLQGVPPQLTYTPTAGFSGRDGFEFLVVANGRISTTALVGIEISPPVNQGFSLQAVQRSDSRVIDLTASFPAGAIWTQIREFDGATGVLWDGQAQTWTGSFTPSAEAQTVGFNSRYWLPGVTVPQESLDISITLTDPSDPPNPPGDGLGGYAWIDTNFNGLRDATEPGDSQRLVELYRCSPPWGVAASATSATSGVFSFDNVPAGEYQIGTATPPRGFSPLGGDNIMYASSFSNCFDFNGSALTLGIGILPNDVEPQPSSSISGFAWVDANADGVRDANELPEPNRRIELFRCGAPWGSAGTTRTDPQGQFEIDGLADGEYQLGTPVPAGGFSPLGGDNDVHGSGFANCVSPGSALGVGIL